MSLFKHALITPAKPAILRPSMGATWGLTPFVPATSDSGKIAIAQVVVGARQHLAAIKPQKGAYTRANGFSVSTLPS
jgi:non-homologous end joining protein Ku